MGGNGKLASVDLMRSQVLHFRFESAQPTLAS